MQASTQQTVVLGALNAANTVNVQNAQHVAVDIAAGFTGTLAFEVSVDGTIWQPAAASLSSAAKTTVVSSIAGAPVAAQAYVCDVTEYRSFRTRVSVFTSGSTSTVSVKSFAVKPY